MIEDHASGTQLIQELQYDGKFRIEAIKPEHNKEMRLHAQCGAIESGAMHIPEEAPWLMEYVRELTSFPKSKFADQVDSTSQALHWIMQREIGPGMGFLVYARQEMERMEREERLRVSSQGH